MTMLFESSALASNGGQKEDKSYYGAHNFTTRVIVGM